MRELKFRAFDKQTKQMSPSFDVLGEFTLLGAIHSWQHDCGNKSNSSLEALGDLRVTQFTGVLDKNGKEIYEGDILAKSPNHAYKYVVVYKTNRARFMLALGSRLLALTDQSKKKEVIGNIFKNPELL